MFPQTITATKFFLRNKLSQNISEKFDKSENVCFHKLSPPLNFFQEITFHKKVKVCENWIKLWSQKILNMRWKCYWLILLKSDTHLPNKLLYLLQWNPFKNDEKYFCFTLKDIFVLKIFKFLSWLYGHVEKTTWLERQG